MQLSFASPWVNLWKTPGGWSSFGTCFFPVGQGSSLVLETTGPRGHTHGVCSSLKWSTVYCSRPKFFGAISFRFDVKFPYHVGVHTSPKEGVVCH